MLLHVVHAVFNESLFVFNAEHSTSILDLEKRHAFMRGVVGLMERQHQAAIERLEDHAMPAIASDALNSIVGAAVNEAKFGESGA